MTTLTVEGVKGIILTALFLLTFIVGVIPVKLVNVWKRRSMTADQASTINSQSNSDNQDDSGLKPLFKKVIGLLSCFAAGVFLATCFLDLLPGVRRTMTHVLYSFNIFTGFPISEFVMVLGFFVILITEQIVLTYKEKRIHDNSVSSDKKPLLTNENENWQEESGRSDHSITGIRDEPDFEASFQGEKQTRLIRSDSYSHRNNNLPHSSLRSLILLIALSMHSVFEGLAVGLQKTTGDVVGIFAALILHKSILGFSLGLNLVQSRLSQSLVIRSIFGFSISAPLGVGVGMGIMNLWDSTTSSLVQGLLQGIATGTFVYVTFFEVLPHEFNSQTNRLLKVLFLILGYSTVTGILFLSGDIKKPFCVVESEMNGNHK
ncbi:zinc transporter ZIP1 [Patella vulgata]|uniref:zinc transporter ZIP1 n=1 Tax=Patella vulgata TaxID=6465 RepID=UPI002180903B|nr:zinc transporter ZIP1 [Patella vulgata]